MYEYSAQVLEVVDGDTVKLDVDLGFSIRTRMTLRLYGIDTPEIVGSERDVGSAAKAYLTNLLKNPETGGWKTVMVKTFKDKSDKYGRLLALVYVEGDPIPVNDRLISAGHAKPYFGQRPQP